MYMPPELNNSNWIQSIVSNIDPLDTYIEVNENQEVNYINKDEYIKFVSETTEIGKFGTFNGVRVPLDIPMETEEEINEAEYQGKEVDLNHPMRAKGGKKKYYVYLLYIFSFTKTQ